MQRRIATALLYRIWPLITVALMGCNTTSPQATRNPRLVADAKVTRNESYLDQEATMRMFYDAWKPPMREGLQALAIVTVAKDGRVLSSRIEEASGNSAMDQSVQKALESVKHVPAFRKSLPNPPDQIVVTIHFSTDRNARGMDWPPTATKSP